MTSRMNHLAKRDYYVCVMVHHMNKHVRGTSDTDSG